MAIATAVQRGTYVHVYDERGAELCSVPAVNGLLGYTSSSVSVKGQGSVDVVMSVREWAQVDGERDIVSISPVVVA
jgi:hypothetical protein